MMASQGKQLVIIVTGANKGIGLECMRNLAQRANRSYLFKQVGAEGTTIYLTSRDEARGRAALQSIKAAPGTDIAFAQLDVSSPDSIKAFANTIKAKHEKVHALINNAGVSTAVGGDGGVFDSKTLEWVLATNYDGVREMTNAFLPLMHGHGRIVNISSGLSSLSSISSSELKDRLRNAKEVKEVDAIMQEFRDAVRAGTYGKLGWPPKSYASSKIALNALTRAFAAENRADRPNLLINYVYPGWVKTDMGGSYAPGTAVDGADTPCWAAIDDIGGKTGAALEKRRERSW